MTIHCVEGLKKHSNDSFFMSLKLRCFFIRLSFCDLSGSDSIFLAFVITFALRARRIKQKRKCFLFILHMLLSSSNLYTFISETRQFIQYNCRQTRTAHGYKLVTFLCNLQTKNKKKEKVQDEVLIEHNTGKEKERKGTLI